MFDPTSGVIEGLGKLPHGHAMVYTVLKCQAVDVELCPAEGGISVLTLTGRLVLPDRKLSKGF